MNAYKTDLRKKVSEERRQHKCLNCGENFYYLSSKKVFCSYKCKSNYHSTRNKRQKWNEENRERRMLYRAKTRAKKKGLDFNIDLDDIHIPDVCPVLGIDLVNKKGKGYRPNAPSLDRIDLGKGYIKGNVRVISAKANLYKNDATLEELERVIEDLRNIKKSI